MKQRKPKPYASDPSQCPCVVNEQPTAPCNSKCFHFAGKSAVCQNCGQTNKRPPNAKRKQRAEQPEQMVAYLTDGRANKAGPWLWRKRRNVYECMEGPHKGTFANRERLMPS